jgi:hypothetical protein
MITVVIADGHILVDDKVYVPLDWEAFSIDGQIGIRHLSHPDIHLFKGRVLPADISLEGVVYATANEFVYAFNARTAAALSYLLVNMKANTDYPDVPFSAKITPNAQSHIADYAFPGYVTVKAATANSGNVYVGATGLNANSGGLEPGESVAFEVDDLSTLFALNASNGDIIHVFGAYRQ